MKMTIDGRQLVAKNLDTARVRDVVELQRQTGWKLKELKDNVVEAESLGIPLIAFLTLRNAGFSPVWDELLDRQISDFELEPDAEDEARAAEAAAAADPPQPLEDSAPADATLEG